MDAVIGTCTSNWRDFGSSIVAIVRFSLSFALWAIGSAAALAGLGALAGSGLVLAIYAAFQGEWALLGWSILAIPAGASLASVLTRLGFVRELINWAIAGPSGKLNYV